MIKRIIYTAFTAPGLEHTDRFIDARGEQYLTKTLHELGETLGGRDARSGAEKLKDIFDGLDLQVPVASVEQFVTLKNPVNSVWLKNHLIALDKNMINELYHYILRGEKHESYRIDSDYRIGLLYRST